MEDKKPVGIATFDQCGNDLFWVYWCDICMKTDLQKWSGCKERAIRWRGYNDRYWWDRVSKSEAATTRMTSCGKKLQIAHRGYVSEEVFEV